MTCTILSHAFRNLGYFRVRVYKPLNSCFFVDTPSYLKYIGRHSNHIGSADMARTQQLSRLNEEAINRLPLPEKGNRISYFPGAVLQGNRVPRGFGVRVTAGGAKSFIINYRIKGDEYRYTIGSYPDWSALRAVREARGLRQRIDRGENPLEDRKRLPTAKSVNGLLDEFVERYVEKEAKLRTASAIKRAFDQVVKPSIGKIGIFELRRSDVAQMLDKVADERGLVMADKTLAWLRKAFNWYAGKDDKFNSPIVKGMARTKPRERARTRVLSDDEIRVIWPLLAGAGVFGALLKTLLLTAQRRDEVATMIWKEIDEEGIWTIPAERYKTKRPNHVPLSNAALEVIEGQPRAEGCDYVFPSRTRTPFSGFAKSKAAFDKAVREALQKQERAVETLSNWTLHDLRRTAKTLMARAGVRPDISERVLGHVIAGVEGTYDRHSYADEKRDALEKLAAMIQRILTPLPANVEKLGEHRATIAAN
jgi:integrase